MTSDEGEKCGKEALQPRLVSEGENKRALLTVLWLESSLSVGWIHGPSPLSHNPILYLAFAGWSQA